MMTTSASDRNSGWKREVVEYHGEASDEEEGEEEEELASEEMEEVTGLLSPLRPSGTRMIKAYVFDMRRWHANIFGP